MKEIYGASNRELQRLFGACNWAERQIELLVHDKIDARVHAFIESLDTILIGTVDESGHPTVSYKGGDAGFVRVVD